MRLLVCSHNMARYDWATVEKWLAADDADVIVVALQNPSRSAMETLESYFMKTKFSMVAAAGDNLTVWARQSENLYRIEMRASVSCEQMTLALCEIQSREEQHDTVIRIAFVCCNLPDTGEGRASERSTLLVDEIRRTFEKLLSETGVVADEALIGFGDDVCDYVVCAGDFSYRLASHANSRKESQASLLEASRRSDWDSIAKLDELDAERRLGRCLAGYETAANAAPSFLNSTGPAYSGRIFWRCLGGTSCVHDSSPWVFQAISSSPHRPLRVPLELLETEKHVLDQNATAHKLAVTNISVRRCRQRVAKSTMRIILDMMMAGRSPPSTEGTDHAISEPADLADGWGDDVLVVDLIDRPTSTLVAFLAVVEDDVDATTCVGGARLPLSRLPSNGWSTFKAPLLAFGAVVGVIAGKARLIHEEECVEEEDDGASHLRDEEDDASSVQTCRSSAFTNFTDESVVLNDKLRASQIQLQHALSKLESERAARSKAERRAASAVEKLTQAARDYRTLSKEKSKSDCDTSSTNFLRSIPFFKAFTEAQIAKAHEAFVVQYYDDSERIISQGESGESFYIVVSGGVRVYVRRDDSTLLGNQVAVLSVGDYFGERALVLKESRASTCIADGPVACWTLDREAFEDAMVNSGGDEKNRTGSKKLKQSNSSSVDHAEMCAKFSGYEHDSRETSKATLERFAMVYSDLLKQVGDGDSSRDYDKRVAELRTANLACKRAAAQLSLLVSETISPDLSLDDALDKMLILAQGVLGVTRDNLQVFFPIDVENKVICRWRQPTEDAYDDDDDDRDSRRWSSGRKPSRNADTVDWSGVVAEAAEAAATVRDEFDCVVATPIAFDDDSDDRHVLAVVVVSSAGGATLSKNHELALERLAIEVGALFRGKRAEVEVLLPPDPLSASYKCSAEVTEAPPVSIGKLRVSSPPAGWTGRSNFDEKMASEKKKKTHLHKSEEAGALYAAMARYVNHQVFIRIVLQHGDRPLTRPWVSKPTVLRKEPQRKSSLSSTGKAERRQFFAADFANERVFFLSLDGERRALGFRDVPIAANMHISVHAWGGESQDSKIAFCKSPMWNEQNVFETGSRILPCALSGHGRHHKVHGPTYGAASLDEAPCSLDLRCGAIDGCQVLYDEGGIGAAISRYNSVMRRSSWSDDEDDDDVEVEQSVAASPTLIACSRGVRQQHSLDQRRQVQRRKQRRRSTAAAVVAARSDTALQALLRQHVMYELTDEDKHRLWLRRKALVGLPHALPKFLLSVDWGRYESRREVYRLLRLWALLPPLPALQLLSVRFPDPKVRSYAVRCLDALRDAELAAVILQLVQVVKFERSHDTALNRFLLRRALRRPSICGHALYWSLATEKDVEDTHHCCRVVYDVYNRTCGDYRLTLGHQVLLVSKLAQIARLVKAMKMGSTDTDRDAVLRDELKGIVMPKSFQLPLSPYMLCRGINVSKCKVMSSAQKPLLLSFQNYYRDAPPHVVIFKCGDDLRQDQLTLQIIRSMEAVWKEAGLDMRMSPYCCVATAADQGFIEVVQDSSTVASITRAERFSRSQPSLRLTRKYAAATEAYYGNRYALLSWISRESESYAEECRRLPKTKSTTASKREDRFCAEKGPSDFRHTGLSPRATSVLCSTVENTDEAKTVANNKRTFLSLEQSRESAYPGEFPTSSCSSFDRHQQVVQPWEKKPAEQENPLVLGLPLHQALDNFARSLAGYCVATYVLGVGDRHNDNIMCTRDGKLFHIDFGHFLGNFKKFFGVKRETAPFVLTPHFEQALGGSEVGGNFRLFEEMSCKAFLVLRRHTDLIMTLLMLMVDCGIPELEKLSDVNWVHTSLMLDQFDDEKAKEIFMDLIDRSLDCKRTRTNHAIHSFVHTA